VRLSIRLQSYVGPRSTWLLLDAEPERTGKESALCLNRLSDLLFILARVANPAATCPGSWAVRARRS